MADLHTRTEILHEIMNRPGWGWLGMVFTPDAYGVDYIDSAARFQREGLGDNDFFGRWFDVYQLAETSTNRIRRAGELANDIGRLYIDGPDWSPAPSGPCRIMGLDPRRVWAAQKAAQQFMYERKMVSLSGAHDFDMLRTDADYWNGNAGSSAVSNAGVTKVASEANSDFGDQALFVNLTGIDGYSRGERLRVVPLQTYLLGMIARLDSGGAILRAYDYTHSAYIQTSDEFSYTGAGWAYIERRVKMPAGCYEFQPQIQGTIASTDAYVAQAFGPQYKNTRRIELPSWVGDGFKVKMVRAAEFKTKIAAGIWDAESRTWAGDLVGKDDYDDSIEGRAPNPNHLEFNDTENVEWAMGNKPLFLYAERQRAEKEPLDAEDDTTSGPFEQVIAYHMHQLALLAQEKQPDNPKWDTLVKDTRIKEAIQTIVRPPQKRVDRQRYENMRV